MRGLIYAVSPEGIIGKSGRLPWSYPGDQRRFKRVTLGSTIIMGRATFDSVGKALPRRRNVVVTSHPLDAPDVERVATVEQALALAGDGDVWFIGGARIYAEGMRHADCIDVTYIPDHVPPDDAVYAPPIDETVFEPGPLVVHEDDSRLTRRIFTRRRGVPREA